MRTESDWRTRAYTGSHQGDPATACVMFADMAGERPISCTNDHPNVSAAVRYPVAANAAKRSFETS